MTKKKESVKNCIAMDILLKKYSIAKAVLTMSSLIIVTLIIMFVLYPGMHRLPKEIISKSIEIDASYTPKNKDTQIIEVSVIPMELGDEEKKEILEDFYEYKTRAMDFWLCFIGILLTLVGIVFPVIAYFFKITLDSGNQKALDEAEELKNEIENIKKTAQDDLKKLSDSSKKNIIKLEEESRKEIIKIKTTAEDYLKQIKIYVIESEENSAKTKDIVLSLFEESERVKKQSTQNKEESNNNNVNINLTVEDFNSAYKAYEDGDYKKAISLYKKVIGINSDDAAAHYNLGLSYSMLRKDNKALDCYKKAIALEPKNAFVYINMGIVYSRLDEFEKALSMCKKALEIEPNNDLFVSNLALTYLTFKKYSEAEKIARDVLAINPNNDTGMFVLGVVYYKEKKYEEALTEFNKALEGQYYSNDMIYAHIGGVYMDLKDYKTAEEFVNNAINLNPNNHTHYILLSTIYCESGDYKKAIEAANKALDINPDDFNSYYNMVEASLYGFNFTDAKKYLTLFIKKGGQKIYVLSDDKVLWRAALRECNDENLKKEIENMISQLAVIIRD